MISAKADPLCKTDRYVNLDAIVGVRKLTVFQGREDTHVLRQDQQD